MQYFVTRPDKTQEGPYDKELLLAQYQAGKYPEGTLVWQEGDAKGWVPIATVIPPSNPYIMGKDYYVMADDGSRQGPYSLEELNELMRNGGGHGAMLCWKQGMINWMPLGSILPADSAISPGIQSHWNQMNIGRQPRNYLVAAILAASGMGGAWRAQVLQRQLGVGNFIHPFPPFHDLDNSGLDRSNYLPH